MMKIAIASISAFLLANISLCYSQAGYVPGQPSIDCTKVHNTVAVILCRVPEAAQADWELNSAWWARYFTANDTQRQMLDRDQQAWRQSLDQLCALPRYQTSEDEAGRAMAETFGRMILGLGIRIPGPQPITQAHVNCVLNAYHARAVMLRSKLTGDALAESLLSPEQHAELQQALAEKGYLRPDQIGSGTHDGEFGPITRNAIKQFQQSLGAASGFLSNEQQSALLESPREREARAARADADKKAREDALVTQAAAAAKAKQDAQLELPTMALEGKDCGWLVIAMGEADQAADRCPADAEFFKQKADEFNVVAGNRCGQYSHEDMSAAYVTGVDLVNRSMKKIGVEDMCNKLRTTILEEDQKRPRKPADTAVPKTDAERKEACKKDYTRCSDNTDFMNNSDALIPAQVACKQAAEAKSKFGDPKWPWLFKTPMGLGSMFA